MTTTPEEVSGSHALTTAEQLFCTLTSWHERVSVYVKGGVANVVGARWRVYAINGSQRTLLFDASSKTLLNEVVIAGIPGQGDTIALYGYNPYGVTGSVKAYMVGWDPSAAVTPVEASDVASITLDLTEQDVCDLSGGYVNLDVAFNANGDPLAALAQIRLYALLGGTDRFQLEQFQIPANAQGIPAVGSVNLIQNYMAGASEFILTAQGRYGTSAVSVTGTLEGETGSAGAGGGGGGGTLAGDVVGPAASNTLQQVTGDGAGKVSVLAAAHFSFAPGSYVGYPDAGGFVAHSGFIRVGKIESVATPILVGRNDLDTLDVDIISSDGAGSLTFGSAGSLVTAMFGLAAASLNTNAGTIFELNGSQLISLSVTTFKVEGVGSHFIFDSDGTSAGWQFKFNGSSPRFTVEDNGNISIGNTTDYGSGVGVIAVLNATTPPTSIPTGGGVLYAEGGALKYIGSSGTITTLASA